MDTAMYEKSFRQVTHGLRDAHETSKHPARPTTRELYEVLTTAAPAAASGSVDPETPGQTRDPPT